MPQDLMNTDMLSTLALPLLFGIGAGLWIYVNRKEQRPKLLLTLCLMFIVGAWGYSQQQSAALFGLLLAFMLVLGSLMLHHWEMLLVPVRRDRK